MNKLAELHLFLQNHDLDLLCVTETWLNADIPNSLIAPKGYNVYRYDRSTRAGGVAIFVRDTAVVHQVAIRGEFNTVEVVCIDVNLYNTVYRVIGFYRPPGLNHDALVYLSASVKCLQALCSTEKNIVILGDFNFPNIDWSCYHCPDNPIYREFLQFVNSYGFYQYVNEPTRDSHILDLVLSTSSCFVSTMCISCPISTSDHNTVVFKVNAQDNANDENSNTEWTYYRDFEHANYQYLNEYLYGVDWNSIFQYCFTTEQCWSTFTCVVNNAVERFIPIKRCRPTCSSLKKKGVRYPQYIKRMQNYKAFLWKKWKHSKCPGDKKAYGEAANRCRSAIIKHNAAKELELIRKNNIGSFYNFVNNKLHSRSRINALMRPDGSMSDSAVEKSEIFNGFFASVFVKDNGCLPQFSKRVNGDVSLTSVNFTPSIVRQTLRKLKPSSSAGLDGISNLFLRKCASSLCLPLCHIFDTSFKNGQIPAQWLSAIVVPIHKSGPTSDPNNYRPISLTSTCCRAMERIINKEILTYLLKHNLISQHQHGFIKHRSTCTNLLECLSDWSLNMQSKRITDVVYFDFRKAFDSVSYNKLLAKITAYGISGYLYEWIVAFLSNRKQAVRVDNVLSCFLNVISGVPQGSVLGPTLFLLFINDVCDVFGDLKVVCKLYADDVKLYTTYDLNETHCDLSTATQRLVSWSDTWQLSLSAQKCTVCRLQNSKWHTSHDCNPPVCHVNDFILPLSNTIRDLGVVVDSNLKFDKHVSAIVHKAHTRAKLILRCFTSRDRKLLVKAFCTYVRPLLEYCTPVWSPHYRYLIDMVEKVQRRFTKRLSGLRHLSYSDRLQVLGLQSLERRRLSHDLILVYKIFHGLTQSTLSNNLKLQQFTNTRGHPYKLAKRLCSHDIYKYFFTNRIVDLWNSLPNEVVSIRSLRAFRCRVSRLSF